MLRLRHVLRVTAFVAALLSFPHSLFAGASCQLNPVNRTVTICTPQNNSTVATTFHVNAGVTDSIQIQYMQVYVNHVLYATQHRNFIDATITVPVAQNALLTVQAREVNSSFFIKAHYTINIVNGQLVLAPLNPTVVENAMQQFTTAPVVPVNWTASCGSINSSGNYTAPLAPGSCTVTATATDGSGLMGSTTATITSPISIMPPSASTPAGGTQQFTATAQVNWTASCGAIDTTGLFTAPNAPGTCTITATAATGIAFTAIAIDTVGPPPQLVVNPSNPPIVENAILQFTTAPVVPVNWSATCGTIDNSGNYTAPLFPGSCTVKATATDGSGRTASTIASITSPISIMPPSATTLAGGTQQFTASVQVNWSASCGTIDATGLFTAPNAPGTCTITATAATGTAFTAQAIDTVGAPPPFVVTPANPTVVENATQQFATSPVAPVNWTASCGTINSSGNYTAPLVPGACTVTATATDGSGRTASTTATITSPITITPPSANTVVNMTQQFSANAGVNWSASCGTINSGGLFTAPANAGSCTITATASSGTAFTAQAIDTVTNPAGISYTTWKNDSGRTGLNSAETTLTLSNVNSTSFGKLFKTTVDGGVWTQPLYMAGLTVNHATHNVLFAGTDNDTMYALDADSGSQLWKKSFLSSGVTPVPEGFTHGTIYPHVGITGTPVIDPASGTLYVSAETLENSGTAVVHRLHALDITTGNEKFGGPVVITAAGFQPKEQLQRPGLLLANGSVYIGFGSQGDTNPYHGWLFAYNPTSLGQTAAWNITDDSGPRPRGAIWMGGSGIASDSEGNIYVATSNGDFDGVTLFGQSVIKLSPALTVLDYFTPYNNAYQTGKDLDLGSGGVLLVP
ncbi:MAG: hypothetical protein ABI383_09360, partial [Acidobacteriaceae bacterium]